MSPENEAESATLLSCFCSSVISLCILVRSRPGSRAATSLALDLVDDLDGAVHRGVGDLDGGGAEAEGVLNRRQRRVVRPHRGCDRPVGGVVGCLANSEARGDPLLDLGQALAGFGERLQRRHRCDVGIDATHLHLPLGVLETNRDVPGLCPVWQSGYVALEPP